ncbi:hypothetical protein CU254_27685 [Amycolatopsis sp. AA4]|uniref:hypothetical protein n=1 Tax=Actinomycetes TaxID=1760 RepID=UPI0001B575CA|nr:MULTISPECIES: hypothetical protein [Actinomycetes]ATY13792.1 hypothetical protein CU254_27685 [Amycolatopsis sp. AA4]EFL09782.1 predicted protein [Streptomyces sp. AA4]
MRARIAGICVAAAAAVGAVLVVAGPAVAEVSAPNVSAGGLVTGVVGIVPVVGGPVGSVLDVLV